MAEFVSSPGATQDKEIIGGFVLRRVWPMIYLIKASLVPYALEYKTHLFDLKLSTKTGGASETWVYMRLLLFHYDPMPENQGKRWHASCTSVGLAHG